MDYYLVLKWLHVIGACVLLGTGAGIAFFMLMAHRTGKPALIAHTASIVVIADTIFTATAAIVQPITGSLLIWNLGWSFADGWIALSLILYVVVGLFWLPVVWIQIQLRDMAITATNSNQDLPPRYHRLFKVWFFSGFPAFFAVMAIVWLMLAKPDIALF